MPFDSPQKQSYAKMGEESDLSLEVVILLIFGVFMLLFGLLLFKIHTGELPYTPDSTYGLFLVIVSFQVITMGKTPFGDLRRSWALVLIGISTAILGMVACFIPGSLTGFVRILVGILLFVGGISLLLQLFISKDKAKLWMKTSETLQHLTIACGIIYAITVILGLVTLFPGITTDIQTAALLIIYAASFFYLSWCIQKVTRLYPPEETKKHELDIFDSDNAVSKGRFKFFQNASLPLSVAILILVGVLIVLLGFLLFPVNIGIIPFSPDGQLGLLLIIYSIQMMALGETPMGQYKRSWLMIVIGVVFAALGIVSCIVPGILTGMLQTLIGLLNLIGGSLLLIKRFIPMFYEVRNPPAEPVPVFPIVKKLMVTQTVLNIVTIVFGLSMLIPGLISGKVVAGILIINGLLLFLLAFVIQKITMIEISGDQPAESPI